MEYVKGEARPIRYASRFTRYASRARKGGERLIGLVLPPGPPRGRIRPGVRRGGDDWFSLLGLQGVELGFPSATAFQLSVWEKTREISWGEVRSYGWLARAIERPGAARAVGRALHGNPLPLLVPCHRVIRADGSPGGFSSGRGWKELLLKFEVS